MRTSCFAGKNRYSQNKLRFTASAILAFLCMANAGSSQSFLGYNTSNYTGVSGVFFNPANAADSRYRWSFNLLQANASIANNTASYKLSEVTNALDDNKLLNKLYGSHNGYAQANADLQGPSLLFNINRKTSFALTTRYRALITLNNIDGSLIQSIRGEEAGNAEFRVTNNNTSLSLNGWMETGITWGNVIFNKGHHFLKGGITAKYIGGVANNTIAARNVSTSISYDGNSHYANNASGAINLAFSGASLSDPETGDLFKFNGKGAGFDLGVSYEYRPGTDSLLDRSDNKYQVKVSLALLDAGSIRFQKDPARSSDYNVGISNSESFNLDALDTDPDNLNAALKENPVFFTPVTGSETGSYKVKLPAHLRADVDVHLHKGFYINAATRLALSKGNDIYGQRYYNNMVITPRIEGRGLGLYVPIQINNVTGFNAGAAFRLGPLVLGSSNILTALGNSKMADVYIGFRFMGSAFRKGDR